MTYRSSLHSYISSIFFFALLLLTAVPVLAQEGVEGVDGSEAYIDQDRTAVGIVPNEATIDQVGGGHFAQIGQGRFDFSRTQFASRFYVYGFFGGLLSDGVRGSGRSFGNTATQTQEGFASGHRAKIFQGVDGGSAEGNAADQIQQGSMSHRAIVLQGVSGGISTDNVASQSQDSFAKSVDGAGSSATIQQGFGGGTALGNRAIQTLSGGVQKEVFGHSASIRQGDSEGTAEGSTATQTQSGVLEGTIGHSAKIAQGTGGGTALQSTAIQIQEGSGYYGHSATIRQGTDGETSWGDWAVQSQSGTGEHVALIWQGVEGYSFSNSASITQSGTISHAAGIIQEGIHGVADITQSN